MGETRWATAAATARGTPLPRMMLHTRTAMRHHMTVHAVCGMYASLVKKQSTPPTNWTLLLSPSVTADHTTPYSAPYRRRARLGLGWRCAPRILIAWAPS